MEFDYFNWIFYPLLIFIARICDVSLGMLRVVFASKGFKKIVPFIGFFEVLLWLIAMGQIMNNLNNIACYFAWAAGYAAGTYVGLTIEEKLAMGIQLMRIITNQQCDELVAAIRNSHFGLTVIDGEGARGPVKILFTTVKRKEVRQVVKIINEYNPSAFYSIEDIKIASQLSYAKHEGSSLFAKAFSFKKGK